MGLLVPERLQVFFEYFLCSFPLNLAGMYIMEYYQRSLFPD